MIFATEARRSLQFDGVSYPAFIDWQEQNRSFESMAAFANRDLPLGTSDEMEAKGVHNTGAFGQGGSIATAGGLVFIAGTIDKRLRAFESRTGKVLWETKLDTEGHTNPMTYLGRNGKQYVVIVSSGISAFAVE